MRKIYIHSFGPTPKPMSQDQLTELVEKLRSKTITPDEVEQIVREHIGYAVHTANRYSQNHTQGDMFFSDALYGIAVALSKAPEVMYDNEIAPFIVRHIKKYVLRSLTYENEFAAQMRKLEDIEIQPSAEPREPDKEFRQQIYDLVKNDFERAVIALRELGLGDAEIAERLSVERKKVSKSRQRIYERFLKEEKK